MSDGRSRYDFATTSESEAFCHRIEEALVAFCGKSEDEAIALINGYWLHRSRIDGDPLLFSESPYYYAMCMAHHPTLGENRINWHEDPALWPPPKGWEFE